MAELWLVDLERSAAALEALERETPRIPEDLARRFDAMGDASVRRARRLAHIALRILLERALGPSVRRESFLHGPAGKPSLPSSGAGFSLAHTRGLALIAVSEKPLVGVDIECARHVRMPEARRAPIEAIAAALAGGVPLLAGFDSDSRFLAAWARLEAMAKAYGTGVGPALEKLRPGHASEPAVETLFGASATRLIAHDIAVGEGIFAAMALEPRDRPPPLRRLPETVQDIAALAQVARGMR